MKDGIDRKNSGRTQELQSSNPETEGSERPDQGQREKSIVPKDPGLWLMTGLILVCASYIVAGFLIPILMPEIDKDSLRQFVALLAVLTGVFAGALVYKKIYDYVNHQKQIRDWQHDYALSQVREIYAPLYEETNRFNEAVQKHGSISVGFDESQFSAMKRKHFRIFLDSSAFNFLETFHTALNDYGDQYGKTWGDIYRMIPVLCSEATGLETHNSGIGRLIEFLQQDQRYLYTSENLQKHQDWFRNRFVEIYRGVEGLIPNKADGHYESIIESIRSSESMKDLEKVRLDCMLKGERALSRLTEIIKDPSRVVLEI
jgi:hypothetical protein